MSKKINKKTKNSQSLKQFVIKLKDLNKFDLELEGDIEDVMANPKAWAEKIAEELLAREAFRIKEAKKLGEEFAKVLD